ncbi:MAG: PEP-CTERM sorting domain-containing protein [Acidobacteriota bacterium]|nr:PEP-CTERM sorting domain-containing protein [Acidobacteriota bacterium]
MSKVLCMAAMTFATATLASATTLLVDDFNYPVGPLQAQNGGTGWVGGWTGSSFYNVAPGSLTYSTLQQSGNRAQFDPLDEAGTNVTRTIASLGADGSTFWLGFLISIDGALDQNTADVGLDDSLGFGRLFIGRDRDNQTNWGVFSGRDASTPYLSSIPIVPGQPLFVAVKIDLNADPTLNDVVTVYFDPNTATTQGAAPGVPGIVFNSYNFASRNVTFALEGSAFPYPPTFVANYDSIRGGTTYLDVAPGSSSATPEPSSIILMSGGLAFLLFSRYRRTPFAA